MQNNCVKTLNCSPGNKIWQNNVFRKQYVIVVHEQCMTINRIHTKYVKLKLTGTLHYSSSHIVIFYLKKTVYMCQLNVCLLERFNSSV